MSFEDRKQRALTLMDSKKMWRSSYAPPLLRLLWKMGFRIPPLPFVPFWQNFLLMSLSFGPLWGIFMWLSIWQSEGSSAAEAIARTCLAGGLFGIVMAAYQYWLRKANKLPDWTCLGR